MYKFPLVVIVSLFISFQSLSQDSTKVDTTQRIFERVEVEASFPGGESAWRRFLEMNLNPMVPIDNGSPAGKYTVYLQFIVDKQGRVSSIKPLTKEGYGMEQEVIRIMKKSGLWTPAFQNGRPVNAYRKQPVTFMVEQEGLAIFTKTPYVLYTDTENELTIRADDVKDENIEIEISEGAIAKNEDGKFIALVKKPGRTIITVYNKRKRNKPVGRISFEVRSSKATEVKEELIKIN